MRIATIVLNAGLFLFTGFVLLTDGAPDEARYVLFTFLLLAVPALTVFVLKGTGAAGFPPGPGLLRIALLGNAVLAAAVCLALLTQPPHPPDPGVREFIFMTVATPVVSLAALFLRMRESRPR